MNKTPDIQDIGDVTRFARNCYYPVRRKSDGTVPAVYYIRDAGGNDVLTYVHEGDSERTTKTITFQQFLDLEQGYYRSRMIEWGGGVVYCRNDGANENHRNHSFRPNTISFLHVHPEITSGISGTLTHQVAMAALSTKRTQVYTAINQLNAGEVVGCALSDNFGLITTPRVSNIQIVRRNKLIGEVQGDTPRLYEGFDHFTYAVNKLWR